MRSMLIAMAAAILAAGSGIACAEESPGVYAGVKTWVNDWTHEVPGFAGITSDSAVLFGPAIEARFGEEFFAEASYLVSISDYTFPDFQSTNFDRRDLEVTAGYMIVPGFGFVAGYKDTELKDRADGIRDRVYGPVLGVIAIAHPDASVSFFAKVNYLLTRFKEELPGSVFEEGSPGWIVELGIKFEFTEKAFGTFGYKYEWNRGNNSDVTDAFSGLTLGVMFGF